MHLNLSVEDRREPECDPAMPKVNPSPSVYPHPCTEPPRHRLAAQGWASVPVCLPRSRWGTLFRSPGGVVAWVAAVLLVVASTCVAGQAETYDVTFRLSLDPPSKSALGSITLDRNANLVEWLELQVGSRYSEIEADGKLVRKDDRVVWTPPREGGSFRYRVKVDERRKDGRYRSYFTDEWAVFRGDRMFPMGRVSFADGARSRSRLLIEVPEGWSVETPYQKLTGGRYAVNEPRLKFDRPVGWMIAGRIGARRDKIAGTDVVVAGPKGHRMRRMDLLTFLTFTLPAMKKAFDTLPPKILLVGAPDPMWRGGLSAPRSLYLHLDRPMVSENGTSTVLHELSHVATRIRGAKEEDDWIAEGLAEYYAIEILYRAGGMTRDRLSTVKARLRDWSSSVQTLRSKGSKGPVTARAALLLMDLDAEIRARTGDRRSLDDATRALIPLHKVSTSEFIRVAEEVAGGALESLKTPLLELE